jgi:hypothetical protein
MVGNSCPTCEFLSVDSSSSKSPVNEEPPEADPIASGAPTLPPLNICIDDFTDDTQILCNAEIV